MLLTQKQAFANIRQALAWEPLCKQSVDRACSMQLLIFMFTWCRAEGLQTYISPHVAPIAGQGAMKLVVGNMEK